MNLEDGLNTIERSIVLDYMKENAIPITVTVHEKDSAQVFPIVINASDVYVAGEETLRMSNTVKNLTPFVGKSVKVSFYYNHVGLYFINRLVENPYGYFIDVPKQLLRVPSRKNVKKTSMKAVISYKARGNKNISLEAFPKREYVLFAAPKWNSVEAALQSTAQELFERFAYRMEIHENDDISFLISVSRYLCQRLLTVAVEGTAEPLDIIYIDSSKVVFGCMNQIDSLKVGNEYLLSLQFPIGESPILKRTVHVEMTVAETYANAEGDIQCFLCQFNGMKREDLRFLQEKQSV
ncbi:MAG: hypothetical protein K6G00_12880 [Treponema sp.]|nr:hypothetical protein [Treponema sp.]